ncbi:MAG: GNAT family N-acetyltransferase [Candidatus Micrarchaeota archaeon]|nr:GNAT family N-acetyltransferase [Candidatus Micrarchaeota archaeon]
MALQKVSFVRASEADWKEVFRVELDLMSKTYASFRTEKEVRDSFKKSNVFLIKSDGELIGTTSYDTGEKGTAYLVSLGILRKHQGQGFGREALDWLLAEVVRTGHKKATLRVHPSNEKAKQMYERRGFKAVRPEENPYGDGEPRLFMEKDLTR